MSTKKIKKNKFFMDDIHKMERVRYIAIKLRLPQHVINYLLVFYDHIILRNNFHEIKYEQAAIFFVTKYLELFRSLEDIKYKYKDIYNIDLEEEEILKIEKYIVLNYKFNFDFIPDLQQQFKNKCDILPIDQSVINFAETFFNDIHIFSGISWRYNISNLIYAIIYFAYCVATGNDLILTDIYLDNFFQDFPYNINEIRSIIDEILIFYERESKKLNIL